MDNPHYLDPKTASNIGKAFIAYAEMVRKNHRETPLEARVDPAAREEAYKKHIKPELYCVRMAFEALSQWEEGDPTDFLVPTPMLSDEEQRAFDAALARKADEMKKKRALRTP
jgi:hypothetical protein